MVVPVIAVPAAPIIRPVIRSIIMSIVIPVRIVITVRVIAVITWAETDTEVKLSIRTRGPHDDQTPGHECNQQKFLHDLPPSNLTEKSMESFPVIRSPEQLDNL